MCHSLALPHLLEWSPVLVGMWVSLHLQGRDSLLISRLKKCMIDGLVGSDKLRVFRVTVGLYMGFKVQGMAQLNATSFNTWAYQD